MTFSKNYTIIIKTEYLNERGEAVAGIEGVKIVCPGLIPGEEAEVKILKSTEKVAFCKIVNMITHHRDREVSKCQNEKCGVCELIFISYGRQLKIKMEMISDIFGKSIGIEPSQRFGYRNKAVIPVGRKSGRIVLGTFRKNSHDISDWESPCPVLPEIFKRTVKLLRTALWDLSDELLPSQLFMRGSGDFYQAGFIAKHSSDELKKILSELSSKVPEVRSTFISLSDNTNSVLVKDPEFITGADHCVLKTYNGSYKVSPSAFFQANIEILDKILKKIETVIEDHQGAKVLDLYSGCGVLSNFPGIDRTCVESNSSSFDHVKADPGSKFITADTSSVIAEINEGGYKIIIADPPRKGIDPQTLKAIDDSTAEIFIYLSCEPKTQKRDIDRLKNFQISEITAYDMFPNTIHIESLAILKRKEQ
ncbi:MAG: class I SAM-dependent RNA methyltransferase [Candidatus Delongbacteria bacterium]|nr:class I SAM-dependent RNA methyltransferase [Candidatus Delongbacteria bacterium]